MLSKSPLLRRWGAALGAASAVLAGCGPSPVMPLPEDRLPREAAQAFVDYADRLSDGELRCSVIAVTHAPRAEIDINQDGRTDYAIDTRQLSCGAPPGRSSVAYFCSASACAYPAIISREDGWEVIPLMSGNSIAAAAHYTEPRFQVRAAQRLISGGSRIAVRDYAWRDGALRRVDESLEMPERLAGR
ncbi:MAG: hypothetical protein GYB36_00475 [Alphaproteobacteria bacterium]|nr:hypothetical protein [Alphaproteobacteria bacterium]